MHALESRLPITLSLLCGLALSGCGARTTPVLAQAQHDAFSTAGSEAKAVYAHTLDALERKNDHALAGSLADRVCGPLGARLDPRTWVRSHPKSRGGGHAAP